MKTHLLALLLLLPSISLAKELTDGIHTTLSKSHELRIITVIDSKVRSVDVLIRNDNKFTRATLSDYDKFQIITLTSSSGGEIYSYKFSNGEYKALSQSSQKHIESARAFRLSALLLKNKFNRIDKK